MKLVIIFIGILLLASHSYAVTDGERETLQRLHNELSLIKQLIDESERFSNQSDKRKIAYQKIRSDLDILLDGIEDAIQSGRRAPRDLPPVQGVYSSWQ